jgi:microcystin-dependent protein
MVNRVAMLDSYSKIPDRFLPDQYASTPVATIIEYAGSTVPANYLLCNGSAVSRTAYPELFAVIGTIYGAGDGSTTFNLPDKTGRVGVGLSGSAEFPSLGFQGGAKTVTLDATQIPAHTHPVGHGGGGGDGAQYAGGPNAVTFGYIPDSANAGGGVYQFTALAQTGTIGQAHNNLQPYLVVNYAIKFRLGMPASQLTSRMVGEISQWAGAGAPAGYLVCDGSAVSRVAYPELFAAIGTTYGAGDGSTTFNLPNNPAGTVLSASAISGQTGTASNDILYNGFTLTVPPGVWELSGMIVGTSSVADYQTAAVWNTTTGAFVPGSRGGMTLVGVSPDAVEQRTRTVVVTLTTTTVFQMYLQRNGASIPSVGGNGAGSSCAWLDAKRLPYDLTKSVINASPVPMLASLPPTMNGFRRIGEMFAWGGSGIPQDTLECLGQAVSRVQYPDLFAAIGTTHGVGDGSTTFNLPDLRGRAVVGQDTSQTEFDVLGETGGEKTHILTIAEMPAHAHNILVGLGGNTNSLARVSGYFAGGTGVAETSAPGPIQNTGGGGAHNNLQPYIVMKWVIKALWTATEVTVNAAHTHRVMDLSGIARGTAAASGGADGDLYLKYT